MTGGRKWEPRERGDGTWIVRNMQNCQLVAEDLTETEARDIAAIDQIKAERDDMNATFELIWKANMRAVKRWQESTSEELTMPDRADLCVWLLEQLDKAKVALQPFAGMAPKVEEFVASRAADGGSPKMVFNELKLADFERAADFLADLNKETEGSDGAP